METDRWQRWHPIPRALGEKLVARSVPDLTDDEVGEVKRAVAKLEDLDELREVITQLLQLATALEQDGHPHVALRLAKIGGRTVSGVHDRIHAHRAIDRAEALAERAKRFRTFMRPVSRISEPMETSGSLRVRDVSGISLLV